MCLAALKNTGLRCMRTVYGDVLPVSRADAPLTSEGTQLSPSCSLSSPGELQASRLTALHTSLGVIPSLPRVSHGIVWSRSKWGTCRPQESRWLQNCQPAEQPQPPAAYPRRRCPLLSPDSSGLPWCIARPPFLLQPPRAPSWRTAAVGRSGTWESRLSSLVVRKPAIGLQSWFRL